jgi:hypothetical protein
MYEDVNHLLFVYDRWKENRKNLVKLIKKMGFENMEVRDIIAKSIETKRHDVMREMAQFAENNEIEI